MKKTTLLKSMLLLCSLIVGNGSVWAQSGPDLTKFTWANPIIDEDFESATVNSATAKQNPATTTYAAMGEINAVYNNDATGVNSYGIEETVFGSKAAFLSQETTKPIVSAITGKTFGSIGAFSCKVAKTNKGNFGLYAEGANGTNLTHAKASVYLQISDGTLKMNSGTGWINVGTYSTDILDIFVIYNNTPSATTYGNSVTLAAKKAHVFVNGICVMDGASPKAFTIPGASLTAFRATTNGNQNTVLNIDNIKVYSGLPTEKVTITSAGWASFSNENEVKIPSGVTAYYASAGNSSNVTLKPIDGDYIPASTGVILSGSEDTYYTTVTSTSATLPGSNLLHAQLTDGTPVGTYYILGVNAGNPVFKLSSGSGTLKAGKAYLTLPAGAQELTIDFDNGDVTGIAEMKTMRNVEKETIYNLAGQRVNANHKGLVIVNGKKYLNK